MKKELKKIEDKLADEMWSIYQEVARKFSTGKVNSAYPVALNCRINLFSKKIIKDVLKAALKDVDTELVKISGTLPLNPIPIFIKLEKKWLGYGDYVKVVVKVVEK